MTYIESHKELVAHPKTKRAARLLGISIPTLIGHLHMLWYWAMDYAPDGELTKHDPLDIADAVMWQGDPQPFLDALIHSGIGDGPGFLEVVEGRIFIHDWMEYAGKLIEKRRNDARRKREERLHLEPAPIHRTSTGHPSDGAGTVPNLTVPHQTQPLVAEEEVDQYSASTPPPEPTLAQRVYAILPEIQVNSTMDSLIVAYGPKCAVANLDMAEQAGYWRDKTLSKGHTLTVISLKHWLDNEITPDRPKRQTPVTTTSPKRNFTRIPHPGTAATARASPDDRSAQAQHVSPVRIA